MKKVCILLVLITYVYHNARFKKRKILVFITEMKSVYCEVRIGSLNQIDTVS